MSGSSHQPDAERSRLCRDAKRSRLCSESLHARGLVLPDLTLAEPAEAYSSEEIWLYIHNLWVKNAGRNATLAAMSEDGQYSRPRAEDVVLATLNNSGHKVSPLGLLPADLLLFLQLLIGKQRRP